ncbi:hypothetical protein LQZ21_11590 [Treponema sp. TIM-1]|uniref:LamG-like jellyroll fold domain-containing protein n=1 Tax=Treponema sp. TIM-1 TaxID=2898417 RepID=UPI00397F3429
MVFRGCRGGFGEKVFFWGLVMAGFMIAGRMYGLGEKTLVLGAGTGWNSVEKRIRVAEVPLIRPNPVLALTPGRLRNEGGSEAAASPDMIISFDEGGPERFADRTGNYRVSAAPSLRAADRRWAKEGTGAVHFSGEGEPGLLIFPQKPEALLAPGRPVKDFSIEFWLYPFNADHGEQILSWTAVRQTLSGASVYQRIEGMFIKNRLHWTFTDFFSNPGDTQHRTLSLSSIAPLIPQTWSHHLIRFDSDTGIVEYLVNGKPEGTGYATATGREGGEVYLPIMGREGQLVLGGHYTGIMDEFRTYSRYIETPSLARYPREGGRVETRPLDLGERNADILKVEALGGRFSAAGASGSGGRIYHEQTGTGNFLFSDSSALQLFIRAGNNPYRWTNDESEWLPITPKGELPESLRGRFVQLAAVFYPSGDGETTPYLDEIRVVYKPNEPPLPPTLVSAIARDGAVDLSWRANPDPDIGGYLIYYGSASGEYFGDAAILGPSPINVGKRTTIRLDGLRNGSLYFFSVAAYNRSDDALPGPCSREVSARPLRMME